MIKIILFIIPFLILSIVFLGIVLILNRDGGKGAIQVTSIPESKIYLNGKYVGNSPLCLCEGPQLLDVGSYDLKITPIESGYKSYNTKITLNKGALTVVDRTFEKDSSLSSGSIITLSEIDSDDKAELFITSFPSRAQVVVDSNIEGETPLLMENITPSDHEIKIIKDGYREKIIKVKTIEGKRLETILNLGISLEIKNESNDSTESAKENKNIKLTILQTPNGFLRVRESDSTEAPQIGTLNTGENPEYLSEKIGWYEIRMDDGKTGWISSSYVKKDEL